MSSDFASGWFPVPGEAARPDPVKSAQAGLRPPLPKRFYKVAGIEQRAGLYVLTLDGRPARTPGKNTLGLVSRDAADALASEWQAQTVEINPAKMPLTRLANAAIDLVAVSMAAVQTEVARYGESDLLCYFAEAPDALAARQREAWQPLLDWAAERYGADFAGSMQALPYGETVRLNDVSVRLAPAVPRWVSRSPRRHRAETCE